MILGNKHRGNSLKNAKKVLELWLELIFKTQIEISSVLNKKELREYFRAGQLYNENLENYRKAVERLPISLEAGEEATLFLRYDERWKLSNPVSSIIKEPRFKEEADVDLSNAVETLSDEIKNGTWMDYYNTTLSIPIAIPDSLQQYDWQFRRTQENPIWFNITGISVQEYNAGFYSKEAIYVLKAQIENIWQKHRGAVFFATPAQGKTTSASILLHKWRKESENNICFMIPSTAWVFVYRDLSQQLHKYSTKNPSYKFIVVIEDIHLVGAILEEFDQMLINCKNAHFLLTSRVNIEAQREIDRKVEDNLMEVLDFPNNYSKELILSILENYNIDIEQNKSKVKSLMSGEQHKNILYTFSEIGQLFEIQELNISWPDWTERLISKSKKETKVLNKDYWHWVFLLLSTFRKYEIEITKMDFYKGCGHYTSTVNRNELGETLTYLLGKGYLVESFTSSTKSYKMTLHPLIAEKIAEFLEGDIDYLVLKTRPEYLILSKYLEEKTIREFKTLKEKLGENFHKLCFDFLKDHSSLKGKREETYAYRLQLYSLLIGHPHFLKLSNYLFSKHDIMKLLLDLNSNLDSEDMIRLQVIDQFDPNLESINSQEVLDMLNLWKSVDIKIWKIRKMASGYYQIKLLFDRKPNFIKECQQYIFSLLSGDKVKRFSDFILRIPKHALSVLDFSDTPILFFLSLYIEGTNRHEASYPQNAFTYKVLEHFEELVEIWNGATHDDFTRILFESIISSLQNFNEQLVFYDPGSKETLGAETEYELNLQFFESIKKRFEMKELLNSHTFRPLAKESLQQMNSLNNHSLILRLILLRNHFRSYYDLIMEDEDTLLLIKDRITKAIMSKAVGDILSVKYDFVRLLYDLNIKLPLNSPSDIDALNDIGPYLLFVTDFSRLDNVMLSNPFYNWSKLIKHAESLNEDRRWETFKFIDEQKTPSQLITSVEQAFPLVYKNIIPQKLIESIQYDSEISLESLEFSLDKLYRHANKELIDLTFFLDLKKAIKNHLKGKNVNKANPEDSYFTMIHSLSLKYNLGTDIKRNIYNHYLATSDNFRNSPFLNAFILYEGQVDAAFDISLFTSLLLEKHKDIPALLSYLEDFYTILMRLYFSREDALDLIRKMSEFDMKQLNSKLANVFLIIITRISKLNLINQTELQKYFNLDFYLIIFHQTTQKDHYLFDMLEASLMGEDKILALADAIGVDPITNHLLKSWKDSQNSRKVNFMLISHWQKNKKSNFFDTLFKNQIGQRVIEALFRQINFNAYEKHERCSFLLLLDDLISENKEAEDLAFQLHSQLIRDRKDPFFMIDPYLLFDIMEKHNYESNYSQEINERLLSFLEREKQITDQIQEELEVIIVAFYGRESTDFLNVSLLLHIITKTWGSLTIFSNDFKSWKEDSKKFLYAFLSTDKQYFKAIKKIFDQDFRIGQEKKLLSQITLHGDGADLFDFLNRYKDNEDELHKILKLTKPEDWEWNLKESPRVPVILDRGELVTDFSMFTNHNFYHYYLLKLLELKDIFPFDILPVMRRMILNIDPRFVYDLLALQVETGKNKIRDLFMKELIAQTTLLSSFDLMWLITLPDLESYVSNISESLTKKLAEEKINQRRLLLYLSYAFYCKHLLSTQKKNKWHPGVVKLHKILYNLLDSIEEGELSDILNKLQDPDTIFLTAFYLSRSSYLDLLNLEKNLIKTLVRFTVRREKSHSNLFRHLPNQSPLKIGGNSGEGEARSLQHSISPHDFWNFLDSHFELDWVSELKSNESYLHLVELLSRDYMTLKLHSSDFALTLRFIFSQQTLRKMRKRIRRYEIKYACGIVENLLSLFIMAHDLFHQREFNVLFSSRHDLMSLLVLPYAHSNSQLSHRTLSILSDEFGRSISQEFRNIYNNYVKMI